MFLRKMPLAAAVSVALGFITPLAHGMEIGGIDLAGSGFLTVGVGKMLGGSKGNASAYQRPLFVSDYAQAGVYDGNGGLQWQPDSKLGLQGTATLPDKRLSFTGQVVSRGARGGEANLEWLYASYKINDKFTVQAGRKRIPMFYYSEVQDVGFALPWTHLPPQLYGWEAVNYNGINLAYKDQWGEWSSAINLLAGSESKKESGYWKVYRGKRNRTDIKWDDILGGDITLTRDWLETRFVYIQSKMLEKNGSGTWDPVLGIYDPATINANFSSPAGRQQIYGLTFNIDYGNFLARSEFITIDHAKAQGYKDFAQILAAGYRFGKWTPMVTVSNYRSQAIVSRGFDPAGQEAHRTTSLTLRYDLTTSSAVKVQYDDQKDRSGPNYTMESGGRFGNARLLTLTYDMVF